MITPCAMQVEVTYYLSHCGECIVDTEQDQSNKSAINPKTLMCPHGHSAIVETSEGEFTHASDIHI